ncbi:hypothetical protein GQ600_5684 [Phytophthora cactorum]|nr:hypothetical protein GQ600_5684 [Phytophthora cactorum]
MYIVLIRQDLDSQLDRELRRVIDSYEKVIISLKKRGLNKEKRGNVSTESYWIRILRAEANDTLADEEGPFMCYIVARMELLFSNVEFMSRSDSIDTIMRHHIEWGRWLPRWEQTGAEKFGKHVYANRHSVLYSLWQFISSVVLSAAMRARVQCGSIGTHRLCKGSTSYALGQVNGPTPVSVYLRVDQRLGKLNDRNIHFGEVADQVCGRMRAGYRSRAEVRRVATPLST